jgi:hypothetical protein
VALDEDGRALGVDARCEQHGGEIEGRFAERLGVLWRGDRMQVDDAEEGLAEVLGGRVLPEAAAVVTEVLRTGRLDAGKDAHL